MHHYKLIVWDDENSHKGNLDYTINCSHWDQLEHSEFCIYEPSAQCHLPHPTAGYWEGETSLQTRSS